MSNHLVDPELLGVLALMEAAPPVTPETLPTLREAGARYAPVFTGVDGKVLREEHFVPGPDGAPDVRILVYRPADAGEAAVPAILNIHGGGYVMGTAEMGTDSHEAIVAAEGCVIVSVDYRLAPETAFPGNIEDCYAALRWLHGHAEALGVDRARIGVMGSSAGSGLAAALAILARDRGEFAIAFQLLSVPMLDDRTCVDPDPHPHAGQVGWSAAHNVAGWTALLGGAPGGEGVSPYAAPARADDLAGLPPAFINIGAIDLFLEESAQYAIRLTRAGVPVEFHVYPGAFHGFQLAATSRVAQQADRDFRAALSRFLKG